MNINNNVSKTAFYTCSLRSRENFNSNPIVKDKYAQLFLQNDLGKKVSDMFKGFKMSNYSVCTRHRIIDDYILDSSEKSKTLVVNIGCGLDSRPYRIAKNVVYWLEIDTHGLIEFKNSILPENHTDVQTNLERVGIDFEKDSLSEKISENIPQEEFENVIVIFEGVFMYLSLEIIQQNMNQLRKVFNEFTLVFDFMDKPFFNYKVTKVEKKLNELGAKFTFFPRTVESFMKDLNLIQDEFIPVTHEMFKYKFSYMPLKLMFKYFPEKFMGYGIVIAKN